MVCPVRIEQILIIKPWLNPCDLAPDSCKTRTFGIRCTLLCTSSIILKKNLGIYEQTK